MKTITLAGNTVEIYDDIESLPITRFNKFNKLLLIDAGIGGNLADVDRHLYRAILSIQQKQADKAVTELENLRQNIIFVQSGITPRHLAFACLVKSINGVECTELTDDALQAITDKFKDATNAEVTAHLEAVKKKIDEQLQAYFTATFDDVRVKEYHDLLRKRTLAILKSIISGEAREEVQRLTNELILFSEPPKFSGDSNAEIEHDRNFEKMCLSISYYLHVNPKNFSVLEYYNAVDYVRDMLKAQKRALQSKKGAK